MQANGLDERFNQTLQNMLVKFVDEKKEYWEDSSTNPQYIHMQETLSSKTYHYCWAVQSGR